MDVYHQLLLLTLCVIGTYVCVYVISDINFVCDCDIIIINKLVFNIYGTQCN